MKLRNLSRGQRSHSYSEDDNLATLSEKPVVLDLTHICKNTEQVDISAKQEEEKVLEKDYKGKRTRRYSKKTTYHSNHRLKKTRSCSSSSTEYDMSCEDSSSSSSSEESRSSFSSFDSEEQEVSWNTSESSTGVVRTKRRVEDFEDGEHVTIWNCVERRKIAGNAAPLAKNLKKYFERHPDCEIYIGQDMEEDTEVGCCDRKSKALSVSQSVGGHHRGGGGGGGGGHVSIWNRVEKRKIAGNAAPLLKNLESYLQKHPECEVYSGQDKELLERKRQNSKQWRSTKESKKMRRVPLKSSTRSHWSDGPRISSFQVEEERSNGTVANNNATIEEIAEDSKDIVIVQDSKEKEMALFVDSVFSDHTKDLATFFSWNDDLCFTYKRPTEWETHLFDALWENGSSMEDLLMLDKGCKSSKGDEEAALELSEEELSLLNDDLDVLVDANSCFSSSFYMTSGQGLSL